MEALRVEANRLHKEQMATRKRELYHEHPTESSKKRVASREYYKKHCPEKKAAMAAYNEKYKEEINLANKKQYYKATWGQGHKCPVCDKSFYRPSEVTRHLEHIHSNESSFSTCSICDKTIRYRDNLDRHMSGEKKFECDDCPAAYKRKEDLYQHKRTEKHYLEIFCEYCKNTLTFRYVAEKERHFIPLKCDGHSSVYATTCQSIIDERVIKANMQDRCFIPPNHDKRATKIKTYYEKNKKDEERKSASKRLYCDHPQKEEKIKAMSEGSWCGEIECNCETHKSITCCSHHRYSHYTHKGYLDCHPFGATCLPGCDKCQKCITPLEGYKRDLGIEYENKFGCKKVGEYDFIHHEAIESQRFWQNKNAPKTYETEWNGEEWERMNGYYNCLFCKKKVFGTTKEKHLIHNKYGILTCISMKKKNEGPHTPCRHVLCEQCGGKTKKDPWEDELQKDCFSCKCKY